MTFVLFSTATCHERHAGDNRPGLVAGAVSAKLPESDAAAAGGPPIDETSLIGYKQGAPALDRFDADRVRVFV